MNHPLRLARLTVVLALAFMLLPGCATTGREPEYVAEFLPQDGDPADYAVDRDWWTAYNDPVLDRLVQTALARNIDLAQAAIRINRALYQANLIGADLVPTFSGNLSGSASRDITTGDASSRSVGGEIGISYELDLWRRVADAVSAAEWEYRATMEDREAARLALINTVINTYFNLAYLNEAIRVTEETIGHYARILEIAQARFQTGKADSVEPAQARQSLLQAENTLLDLHTQRQAAGQILRDLLNEGPNMDRDIPTVSLLETAMPPVDLDVPLAVLINRPDLRAAEYRLQSAFRDLSATGKSWLPSVSLGSSLRSSNNTFRGAFEHSVAAGTVTISLPFLDWNRVYWNVKISQTDFDAVRLDFEQAVTTALNEVDTYYFNAQQAGRTVRLVDEKYQYDLQISRYYRERWDAGAGELKDLLSALNTEASSRLSLLSSRYEQVRAENLLYESLAGRYTRL